MSISANDLERMIAARAAAARTAFSAAEHRVLQSGGHIDVGGITHLRRHELDKFAAQTALDTIRSLLRHQRSCGIRTVRSSANMALDDGKVAGNVKQIADQLIEDGMFREEDHESFCFILGDEVVDLALFHDEELNAALNGGSSSANQIIVSRTEIEKKILLLLLRAQRESRRYLGKCLNEYGAGHIDQVESLSCELLDVLYWGEKYPNQATQLAQDLESRLNYAELGEEFLIEKSFWQKMLSVFRSQSSIKS